jgi:hypothetical protein
VSREPLRPGDVVQYPYLWRRQAEDGETEGRKDRPVCLVLAVRRSDLTHLALLAITSQPPQPEQKALAIPDLERRRVGLDANKAAWIMVDEYNYDIAERSFYFDRRQKPQGTFSTKFLAAIAAAFKPTLTLRDAKIDRTAE